MRHRRRPTPIPAVRYSRLPNVAGRFTRSITGQIRYTVPMVPEKHPRQIDAETRARRLRRPRGSRLQRPQLHRRHEHQPILEPIKAYVAGSAPFPLLDLSPYDRALAQHSIASVRPTIPEYKWDHQWRLNDIADHYGLDR